MPRDQQKKNDLDREESLKFFKDLKRFSKWNEIQLTHCNMVKMLFLSKYIQQLNAISIKIPAESFKELHKIIFILHGEIRSMNI